MAELADQSQVLARRQRLIDGGKLTGQPDRWTKDSRLPHHIQSEDPCATPVGQERRCEDSHERRFARAVWAKEPKDRSARHSHVDALQRRERSEALPESFDEDRGVA